MSFKSASPGAVPVVILIMAGLMVAFSAPPVTGQSTVKVIINNFAYTPNKITVVIGVNNTVMWTNEQTGVIHTVTANDNSWGSGTLSVGNSYTHTFTAAGTFGYHCSIHTYITGTVIVLSAGTPISTSSTTSAGSSSIPTAITTSSSSSSTPSAIPEYPFYAVGALTLTVLILAAYLLVRRALGLGSTSDSDTMKVAAVLEASQILL